MTNGITKYNPSRPIRAGLLMLALMLALCLVGARAEVYKSGTCGDGLTWTLDDEGTLIIRGEGDMDDFSDMYANRDAWDIEVRQLIIEEGVTGICDYAFYGCILNHISLPNSLRRIGNMAFAESGLSGITLPDGLTAIGENAFYYCSLTEIDIPDSVTAIGAGAFMTCQSLTRVKLPRNLTEISACLFMECYKLTEIDIPDRVTAIGENAFIDSPLTRVILPEGLISIGSGAFSQAAAEELALPSTLTSIGENAFASIKATEVTLPAGLTTLGDWAFPGWVSINVPPDHPHFSSEDGVLYDRDRTAVLRCPTTKTGRFVIPDTVERIGSSAFYGCSALTDIVLPDGLTEIGPNAFRGCGGLVSVTVPDGVTAIGCDAFYSCAGLIRVALPESLSSLDHSAFMSCSGLESMVVPGGAGRISRNMFLSCTSLTALTIMDGVTAIDANALGRCPNLSRVYIPASVTSFDGNIFGDAAFGGTIYCLPGSQAAKWASAKGYKLRFVVDDADLDALRDITLPGDFRLALGRSRLIAPTVFPDFDHAPVTWESSAPEIASVEDGWLTANGLGLAVITARMGDKSATLRVEIFTPLEDFEVIGEVWNSVYTVRTITPENIVPEGARTSFTWAASDKSLATVNDVGQVTCKSPGDVTITVTDTITGLSRDAVVHVCPPVSRVEIEPTSLSMAPGQKRRVTAYATSGGETFTNQLITFGVADEPCVSVDSDGIVTALDYGTCSVYAIARSGSIANCEVTVREAIVTTLPASLTAIEAEAFMGDLSLESVVIPEGCASIGPRAFAGCANLVHVRIPAGTDVAADAFEGCDCAVIEYME